MNLEDPGHENSKFMLKYIAKFVKSGKKTNLVGRKNVYISIEPHNWM
jgi:hypothetical protein